MHLTTDARIEREVRLRMQLLQELRMMTRRVAELEAIAGRNQRTGSTLQLATEERGNRGLRLQLKALHGRLLAGDGRR